MVKCLSRGFKLRLGLIFLYTSGAGMLRVLEDSILFRPIFPGGGENKPAHVASNMQSLVNELVKQATETGMIVNDRKTKEMLIGSIIKDPPLSVSLSGTLGERVTTFKLVVHVANNLKQHVDAISSKVSSRLYFLKAAQTIRRRTG